MTSKKIVTVTGATGNQGSSVLTALFGNPAYQIRALTRRPHSDAAKALSAKGAEVVAADLNDVESLKKAFAGSHVIYGVTDFFEPFGKLGPEKAMEIEAQQGVNIATAAAATPTLEHFIWSTLPNAKSISGGKYLIPHFEGKNRVDAFIRSNAGLLSKTTFLWVTWYHSNYTFPMFTPYFIPTGNKYVQFANYSPQTKIETIGDVRSNVGPFVAAILADPARTHNGAVVKAEILKTTAGELLKTWGRVTGNEVAFVQTDTETFNGLWPMWAKEMGTMMLFWEEYGDKSWTEPLGTNVLTMDDLGITASKIASVEEALRALSI